MKRKIGLIQALQHEPELVILDEPTEGLDPVARESIHQLLSDLKKKGCTIFYPPTFWRKWSAFVTGWACFNQAGWF